jgi:anti-sigma B factor antagonist
VKLIRRRRRAVPPPPVPARPFGVHAEPAGYGLRVTVTGELDIATAPQLRAVLAELPAPGGLVVIDLCPVTFMDSTGLGVILRLHAALTAEGSRLAVVCPDGPARLLLQVSGLEDELPLFGTLDEAERA